MKRWAIVAALASGCVEYAHTSWHNAPGNTDVRTPMPHENGDPKRYEDAADPGTQTFTVIALPSAFVGTGRFDDGHAAGEFGVELRFEYHRGSDGVPFAERTFAITAGPPMLQTSDSRGSLLGATFVEANYRFLLGNSWPLDIGAGPALYASDREVGAQLTVRLPILAVRGRYMQHDGFELWAGLQIPIPFLFERSQ